MEAENMQNSDIYRGHCTEEMTVASKGADKIISVTNTALPQCLSTAASLPGTIGRLPPQGATGKLSKKRSRAPRRVHTMVLHTDKSNFKAMVQHLTGITSANIADSALFPNSKSFEEYLLPKSTPAIHPQYSSARLKSIDTNNPPFAFYASCAQPLYLDPNFPFADKSSMGIMPNFSNSKAPMATNPQQQGMVDLSSASLWEEITGMALPTSGLYTNM